MNKYFLTISFLLFFITTFSQQRKTQSPRKKISEWVKIFSGRWTYSDKSTVFNLSLDQNGKAVIGSHCSVIQHGNRIDCSEESSDSITVRGNVVNSNTANVEFKSTYSDKIGKASITILNKTKIKWQIIKEPDGEYYIPKNRTLTKE